MKTGNTILITGGGSGIGRGLAQAFHRLGNQVIISGRTQATLDAVTAECPGMAAYTVDMADAASIATLAAAVRSDFPQLNVLINNAGTMRNEDAGSFDETVAADTVATNLLGPLRLTGALLPHLERNANPVVMLVSSGLAFVPLAMTPTYCATKAAIHSYAQSLRFQLRTSPLRVVELVPPYVATTLMGDRQANDPTAMPLDGFIEETMRLLAVEPPLEEICVERVAPLRTAADKGPEAYEKMFAEMNARVAAGRSNELTQAAT